MSTAEDDDLKFLRAAASRLSDLGKLFQQILRKPKHDLKGNRHRVRETDMFGIFALVYVVLGMIY
jgi:hypothetical protein